MLKRILMNGTAGLALLSLVGCGTPIGDKMSQDFNALVTQLSSVSLFSDGYLADKSDRCFAQRTGLAENGQAFDPKLLEATLLGAIAGGGSAVLTGGSVARGALIGAGIGLAAGYLRKLQEDGLNGNEIAMRARGDIQKDNARIDALLVSFDALSACRRQEASTIQSAYNAKTIDRPTADAQMATVRQKFSEDRAKFREIAEAISSKSDDNAAIYNVIAADSGANALEVQEYRPGRRSASLTRKSSTPGTEDGSLKAGNRELNALQKETLTNVQKRDDCFEKVMAAEEVEGGMTLDIS